VARMPVLINSLYLAVHLAGLGIVLRCYKGTRGRFAGAAAFILLGFPPVVSLLAPRNLGYVDQWPGAAFLVGFNLAMLSRCLGVFTLLGFLFTLRPPRKEGPPTWEVRFAFWLVTLGLLPLYYATYLDDRNVSRWFLLLEISGYFLIAWAVFRRFGSTPLALLAAIALTLGGVLRLVPFGMNELDLPPALVFGVIRWGSLVAWGIVLWFLAAVSTGAEAGPLRGPTSLRLPVPPEIARPYTIPGVFLLFAWVMYERIIGGGLASSLTWAKISLPLVLLFICWGGTFGWFGAIYALAASNPVAQTTIENKNPSAE